MTDPFVPVVSSTAASKSRAASRGHVRQLIISAFVATVAVLSLVAIAAPAQAATRFEPFQVQFRALTLIDLPGPTLGAIVGDRPGHADLTAVTSNTTTQTVFGTITVRWLSVTTGRSGIAVFPVGYPPPVGIDPGVGNIVVTIEGGAFGFGTVYVP